MKLRALTLLAALAALLPRVALACPNCVGNDRLSTTLRIVAVFMTVPFLLLGVVLWAIRRAQLIAPTDAAAPSAPLPPSGGTAASDGSPTALD
jgi:hypothetical protein